MPFQSFEGLLKDFGVVRFLLDYERKDSLLELMFKISSQQLHLNFRISVLHGTQNVHIILFSIILLSLDLQLQEKILILSSKVLLMETKSLFPIQAFVWLDCGKPFLVLLSDISQN